MVDGIQVVAVRTDPPAGAIAYAEVIAGGGEMPQVSVDPDADACIFYTSGTTGFPKGAQLTHRGCIHNLMNMGFSGQVQALATARATGVPIDPNVAPPVPVALTRSFRQRLRKAKDTRSSLRILNCPSAATTSPACSTRQRRRSWPRTARSSCRPRSGPTGRPPRSGCVPGGGSQSRRRPGSGRGRGPSSGA